MIIVPMSGANRIVNRGDEIRHALNEAERSALKKVGKDKWFNYDDLLSSNDVHSRENFTLCLVSRHFFLIQQACWLQYIIILSIPFLSLFQYNDLSFCYINSMLLSNYIKQYVVITKFWILIIIKELSLCEIYIEIIFNLCVFNAVFITVD